MIVRGFVRDIRPLPVVASLRGFTVAPLLVVFGSFVLLFVLWNLPLVVSANPQTATLSSGQLTQAQAPTERSRTDVRLPNMGVGQFLTRFRVVPHANQLAGELALALPERTLQLGPLEETRRYAVLLPSTRRGDLYFSLATDTIAPSVNELQAHAANFVLPPLRLPLHLAVLLACVWLVITQLGTNARLQRWLLLAGAGALCLLYLPFRGQFIPYFWLPAGVLMATALVLRMDTVGAQVSQRPVMQVLHLFALWRVLLWLVAGFALWYASGMFQFGNATTYGGGIANQRDVIVNTLYQMWGYWDGEHYQRIATSGYVFRVPNAWPNIAFFPLYPIAIKLLLWLGNSAIAGLIVSNTALLLGLLLLHRLLTQDFGPLLANRTVLVLLLFPSAFFFGAVYSESLSLALAIAVLWALRRQRWWIAGIAGMFLAVTRLPGVMVAPVIVLAYMAQQGWRWRDIRWPILAAGLPPLGLLVFMAFQWWQFGTPFAFLIAQQAWQQRLSPPWVIPQILFTRIFYGGGLPPFILSLHLGAWLLVLVLMLVSLRRLPWQYSVLGLMLLVPPYLSSWSTSVARHVLLGVPVFVMLALCIERPWLRRLVLAGMAVLLVICTALFVNGFWIA